MAQWAHCPSGQAQNGQHSYNHCAWHCGGLDVQAGGGRGKFSADIHVARVWSIGHLSLQHAVLDNEFPPRGPPPGKCRPA